MPWLHEEETANEQVKGGIPQKWNQKLRRTPEENEAFKSYHSYLQMRNLRHRNESDGLKITYTLAATLF